MLGCASVRHRSGAGIGQQLKRQMQKAQAASSTCISMRSPTAVAMFTSASRPNRLLLPRMRSETRG